MMSTSVTATPIEGYPAWLLTWEHTIIPDDIAPAFRSLTRALDESTKPLWIIVDLRANPTLPILETFSSAFRGPFMHKNMGEWLVVGSNSVARTIGRTLSKVTNRSNILWMNSMEEAFNHMKTTMYPKNRIAE